MKDLLPKAVPHLIAIVAFLVISIVYVSPVLQGKTLHQHDVKQSESLAQNNINYRAKTGILPLWAPSAFSGMPAYMVYMDYPNSIPTHIGRFIVYLFPTPINLIFLYLLGAYLAMTLLGYNPYISALGAVAYAFAAYNIINIGAGHISKVVAVATAPPFIAAVIITYRGKIWLGGALTALFAAIHQYSNFIQITYYLTFSLVILGIIEFVLAIKKDKLKEFALATLIILAAGAISISSHISRYWSHYEYSKETIRGQGELSKEAIFVVYPELDTLEKEENKLVSSGLDREYAFKWSYGKTETLNLLIPNFSGGSSFQGFEQDSETFNTIVTYSSQFQMPPNQFINLLYQNGLMPSVYWGDQHAGTGGPAYMGALVIFLFVFSMIASKHPLKWWGLASVILFLMIAWGKYLAWFNDFMFYYFPLFNKFRAVTMVLSILPLPIILVIGLGLKEVYDYFKLSEEKAQQEKKQSLLNALKYTTIGVGGLVLLLALVGGALIDFEYISDVKIQQALASATQSNAFGNALIDAAREDRIALMKADAWRSLAFISLGAGALWLALLRKIPPVALGIGLILLILIDLWMIDKRYLNDDSFVSKRETIRQPTAADQEILRDEGHYRVLNLTVDAFNDATTSYYHNSIGGYHGAKLRRYQELIEAHISQNNLQVINMLNTKYIIVADENRKPAVRVNEQALGNAWFVKEYKMVDNAEEELKALKDFNALQTAIIDQRYKKKIGDLKVKYTPSNSIVLQSHTPDELTYEANVATPQLAVFSEIYYNNQLGWNAYIDGKPIEHFRVNYVLRGLVIPKGKHTIQFKFEPTSYHTGETITLIASILLIVFLIGGVWMSIRRKQ
ncbi:MAG: hypothetical protein ACFB0B_07645 [Thermonemataceae bacterium]